MNVLVTSRKKRPATEPIKARCLVRLHTQSSFQAYVVMAEVTKGGYVVLRARVMVTVLNVINPTVNRFELKDNGEGT